MQADHILQVFRLVSDYLSLNDALNLLCLNTYFYENLPNSSFKRIIVHHAITFLLGNEKHPQTLDQVLQSLNLTSGSYDSIYESLRSVQDLIKDPYGARGFQSRAKVNRDYDWGYQNSGTYSIGHYKFVSMYDWKTINRRIELPGLNNRFLIAKGTIARRWDCGAKGQIVIKLDNSTKLSRDIVTCPKDRNKGRNIKDEWVAISVKCKVPDEVKSVNLKLKGSDTKLCTENYGERFGFTSVRVLRINYEGHTRVQQEVQ